MVGDNEDNRETDDPRIRGSVINGYLKFIRKKWGSDAVEECAKVLGKSPDSFVEGDWYKYEYSKKLLNWIADTKGPEQLENLGRFTVPPSDTVRIGFPIPAVPSIRGAALAIQALTASPTLRLQFSTPVTFVLN